MFAINHAATALLVKRRYPQASFVLLLVSVQLMELLWVVFNALGLERTQTEATVTTVGDIHLAFMPYSHSVLSGVVLAVVTGLIAARVSGYAGIGWATGWGVISHLILDLVTHEPDIALAPWIAAPKLGLGLYSAAPLIAFLAELGFGVLCWWIWRGTPGLLALIVLFNLANLSMFSASIPGPEQWLAGKPGLIVAVIAGQIAVTLFLVGWLARRDKRPRTNNAELASE